jgi:hypothetical protein
MSTIVTRAGKGAALTWTEGDANITNLNNDKIESVVEDTSPQLGGDLDVNGHQIVSSSNGNINIVPNGTGNINLTPATGHVTISATNFPTGTGSNGQVLSTDGMGNATWASPAGGGDVVNDTTPQLGGNLDVNGKSIISTANGNIAIVPDGTGNIQLTPTTGHVTISATNFPTGTGTSGQVLATDGTGNAYWNTPASGGASALSDLSDVSVAGATSGELLVYNGTAWARTLPSDVVGVSTANSANSAGVASTVTVIADNTTAATNYPLFANAVSGDEDLRTDSSFTYNPSTGVLTATQFTGAGSFTTLSSLGAVTLATSSAVVTTNSSVGNFLIHTNGGTNSGFIQISAGANQNITVTPNGTGKVLTTQINYSEKQNDLGTSTWATGLALLASNGNVQTTTVNAATFTLNALSGLISGGNSVTLFIIGGTTAPTSITQGTGTWKWAGGSKALSGVTGTTDVLSIYYNSANATHYASISRGFV